MWRAKEIESTKVIDTIDELGRLSRWQLLWRYPTVLIYLLHATMLGRVEKAPPLWLRSFGWIWSLLRKIEGAFYQTLFMKDDSPRIAHPSWLIRRGMRGAIERSIRLDDRHIVVIADDPGLGREVARSHPDIVVQSFPVSATARPRFSAAKWFRQRQSVSCSRSANSGPEWAKSATHWRAPCVAQAFE